MGGALGHHPEGVVGVALVARPAARVGRGLGVREGDARGERDEREREDRAAGAIRPGDAREHRGRVEAKDATKPCLDVCGCAFAPRAHPRFAPPLPSAKNNTSRRRLTVRDPSSFSNDEKGQGSAFWASSRNRRWFTSRRCGFPAVCKQSETRVFRHAHRAMTRRKTRDAVLPPEARGARGTPCTTRRGARRITPRPHATRTSRRIVRAVEMSSATHVASVTSVALRARVRASRRARRRRPWRPVEVEPPRDATIAAVADPTTSAATEADQGGSGRLHPIGM